MTIMVRVEFRRALALRSEIAGVELAAVLVLLIEGPERVEERARWEHAPTR